MDLLVVPLGFQCVHGFGGFVLLSFVYDYMAGLADVFLWIKNSAG